MLIEVILSDQSLSTNPHSISIKASHFSGMLFCYIGLPYAWDPYIDIEWSIYETDYCAVQLCIISFYRMLIHRRKDFALQ